MAVIAGERVSRSARAAWAGEIAWLNSVPQWRLTMTAWAPLLRALRASLTIRPADAQLKLQAWGTCWPLETAVNESRATLTPLTVEIVALVASFCDRAVPACFRPARSRARS